MAANVIDASPSAQGIRGFGRDRKGDGTANGPSSWTARTASDALANDLQEIGVKAGFGVTISAPREFPFRGTDCVGLARTVGFSGPEVTLYAPERVRYQAIIFIENKISATKNIHF